MKYFRKHPDLLLVASYPNPLVRVMATKFRGKKILLLTDAADNKQHKGFITRTAWNTHNPFSFVHLIERFIYNHETQALCILFHPQLFGKYWSYFLTGLLTMGARLSGKHIVLVSLDSPKTSTQPTITEAFAYFTQRALFWGLTIFVQKTITGYVFAKKASSAGKLIAGTLFDR